MKTCKGSLEPTAESVSDDAARQVLAFLELLEVRTHLGRCPATVASDLLNILPVIVEGIDADHGIVGRAAAQSSGARIQNTQWISIGWRVKADVLLAVTLAVHHLRITLLTLKIGVMVYEVIPLLGFVLGALQHHGRHLWCDVVTSIATGLYKKDLVASEGETRCERTSSER